MVIASSFNEVDIADIWQANIWQNQKLPKIGNFLRGVQEPIGSQPIESQIFRFANNWHANYWHQTN
jgi:hypothetical protein